MSSSRPVLERIGNRVPVPQPAFERLVRRRDRKARNKRIGAGALAIIVTLVSFASLTRTFRPAERPADAPKPPGIFSEVGGWITYGDRQGIWAVDPSHPYDRGSQIRLSPNGGTPLAWSSDGSQLLISRESLFSLSPTQLRHGEEAPASRLGLFVLQADGTETHLFRDEVTGASFSPDGTTVIFAPANYTHLNPGIYRIDADGSEPELVVEPSWRYPPGANRRYRTELYFPTFSPDGTQIAYFDGFGDNSHSLRVVDSDGSDLHVLIDSIEGYRIGNLVWSPDGTHLAFGRIPEGIYTIGVDGSGLTLLIAGGAYPHWSPDGSRISYQLQNYANPLGQLRIAAADGTHSVGFTEGSGGPWNPLVQPEPEVVAEASSVAGSRRT